ncbi:MAG: hypothetical protein VW239_00305 [Candidatus Nanopelagicales bacterium]
MGPLRRARWPMGVPERPRGAVRPAPSPEGLQGLQGVLEGKALGLVSGQSGVELPDGGALLEQVAQLFGRDSGLSSDAVKLRSQLARHRRSPFGLILMLKLRPHSPFLNRHAWHFLGGFLGSMLTRRSRLQVSQRTVAIMS